MNRCPLLGLLGLIVSLAAQPAQKEKHFAAYFPAETKGIVRIDVEKVFKQRLFNDFLAAKMGGRDEFFQQFQTWTGIQLGQLRTAWVAVIGKDRVVIVLQSTFDVPTIQATVLNIDTAQVVQRPGVPFAVVLPDNKRPGTSNMAAVLDDSTLVFGQPDLVDTFLAALKGKGKALPPARAALCAPLATDTAMISAVVFDLDNGVYRQAPWLRLFTYGRVRLDTTETTLVAGLALGLEKPEMKAPATKLIEGARDLYGMLDQDLRKLGPVQTTILEGLAVKPSDEGLALELKVPREMAEGLLRKKLGLQ